MHSVRVPFAALVLTAVALGALVNGCSTNSPNPTITAPPLASSSFTPTPTSTPVPTPTPTRTSSPTPSPTPTSSASAYLQFFPNPITLTSKSTQTVTIDYCNPSCQADSTTALQSDNCDSQGIAQIQAGLSEYGFWNVTAGNTNGTCTFSVVDTSGLPSENGLIGTETVINQANAKTRSRIKSVGGHL